METGEVSRQARPQGFITADQLASAIASASASAQTALGMPTPPSPGRIKVLMLTLIRMSYEIKTYSSLVPPRGIFYKNL